MIRLIALGVLGYIGYKYFEGQRSDLVSGEDISSDPTPVAGGPLSEHATLQTNPNEPPAVDPYASANVPAPAG